MDILSVTFSDKTRSLVCLRANRLVAWWSKGRKKLWLFLFPFTLFSVSNSFYSELTSSHRKNLLRHHRKTLDGILHQHLWRPHRGSGKDSILIDQPRQIKKWSGKDLKLQKDFNLWRYTFQSSPDFILNLSYNLGFGEDFEVWERNQRDIAPESKVENKFSRIEFSFFF